LNHRGTEVTEEEPKTEKEIQKIGKTKNRGKPE
jgi:hypothetical protein